MDSEENNCRADRAAAILADQGFQDTPEGEAVDVIANLLHLSARDGWDYTPADLCRIALDHFKMETR